MENAVIQTAQIENNMEETTEQLEEDVHDTEGDIQVKKQLPEEMKPYMWKKGQSGNPAGRPKGKTMKEYVKEMLSCQTEDERQEFLKGLSKDIIWQMAEGRPEAKVEVNTVETPYDNLTVKQRKDRLQRAIEELGEDEGKERPDIPNGGDIGISEIGKDTQGGGELPKVCTGECKESSYIVTTVPLENNRDNNIVDNTATDKQPQS